MGLNMSGGHPAMDYDEHTRTYQLFLRLTKITIIGVVLLLVGMVSFLV